MKKEFSLSRDKAMINFTAKYCVTSEALLDSYGFKKVLGTYIKRIKKRDCGIYNYIVNCIDNDDDVLMDCIVTLFKLLVVLDVDSIKKIDARYACLLKDTEKFVELIEGLYNFWRKIERYTIVHNKRIGDGLQNVSFIEANYNFTKLVLDTYRKIEETVLGYNHKVYRQLSAGGNVGLILNDIKGNCPEEYSFLNAVPFVDSILLQTPFISYPKRNKRSGIFKEEFKNPLEGLSINADHWFCFPIKVGELLAYVYFHRDFMTQGVSLSNLFEIAREEEYNGKKPDIIYVYGIRDNNNEMKTVFYKDKSNDIILGYANHNEDIDYFGYMKKMLLTIHNIKMIESGYIPIHGAMVNITMKNGKTANVIIMGDSGAGKSESLEAFRQLSEDYIKDMTIIFDDMGVVKIEKENELRAYGTEIGAFVRLDDLDVGYAYKNIDRSIFMNPDKINARVIIPVASYSEIMRGYPVDIFLYANNYEEGEEIQFFNTPEEAIPVFKAGARMAKGTTTEKGLVTSYFANPFGPVQRKEEMDKLLEKYFNKFYENNVKVGVIRTCLGIDGKEKEGPRKAAVKLFELIKSL
ncbi:hypothetical protein CLTEP_04280 [Clostridium tepidiprofundi DSM 19306]|uniref:Phosphoenolpyruvate carboxykinase n=1 Tax=Clostridium tepidiprofundi DSM 19306 TaxID=1121338 RepID=A0A151B819_9CLOT|nr:phosphoenolpyruvate carboxykinase [Clostridium tepidiprofundi]KYH36034.1 hypothetical protein CLTEP_04280 [Clostridium tepidiprofundi DSM 19306]